MPRSFFLTLVGAVGLAIGLLATFFPETVLAIKGVALNPVTGVWVREVGVSIVAVSVIVLLVRRSPDTPTLRAVLWGNALLHAGLLPIEIAAFHDGVITRVDGIVPNSILHVAFGIGFVLFASASLRRERAEMK